MTEGYIKQEGSEPEWVPPKRSVGWWIIHGVPAFIRVCVVLGLALYFGGLAVLTVAAMLIKQNMDVTVLPIYIALSSIAWLVDYVVLLIGFRNPKRQLLYGIGLLIFHIMLSLAFIIMSLNTKDYGEIILMVFVGIRLCLWLPPLHTILKIYPAFEFGLANSESVKPADIQYAGYMHPTVLPFKTCIIDYEFEVNGKKYQEEDNTASRCLAHKWRDYKERGRPLRVIYSKTNPKYNMILQD